MAVRGKSREFGSRLSASCDLTRARASPRMRIDKCAGLTALAEILDPRMREWTNGRGESPAPDPSERPCAHDGGADPHALLSLKHRVFHKKRLSKSE